MSFLGRIMQCFPALVLSLTTLSCIYFIHSPGWLSLSLIGSALYGFPLLCFRIHQFLFPIPNGLTSIQSPRYSPWWGSHQIQLIYLSFPALESALRCIPGLFSIWLRLWGSRIGKNVYWTPAIEITDRSLLEVGDDVVFGHRVICISHVISPRRNSMALYVKLIRIESRAFIGAGSRLGPGVVVKEGTHLPVLSDLYVNEVA